MEAQSNQTLTDHEAQLLRVGGFVEGVEPGVNRPRWEFWWKRLGFLEEASDGRVREIMEHGVEYVIQLEKQQSIKDWLAEVEVDDEQSGDEDEESPDDV